jgi:hypothetical protein
MTSQNLGIIRAHYIANPAMLRGTRSLALCGGTPALDIMRLHWWALVGEILYFSSEKIAKLHSSSGMLKLVVGFPIGSWLSNPDA